MRATTAKRFLFGNWTDVVRRAVRKASPVASVESDAVKAPSDAREPSTDAGEPLPDTVKPSSEAVSLAVELPSDAVETAAHPVQVTKAEKRVNEVFKQGILDWEQSRATINEKQLDTLRIGKQLIILKKRYDLATGPERYAYKNLVSEWEKLLGDRRYTKRFTRNDVFFRKLAHILYHSPHITLQEMAPYTRYLQVDLAYHVKCAIYLQRARIGHLDPISKYDLIKILHNTLWHWFRQNPTLSMEIQLMIRWPSNYISKDLIRHFHDYQMTWAKLIADRKAMSGSFNDILLRRMRTSARQAVFNAHYHLFRREFHYRNQLRAMISELDKEGGNSFRYVQIGYKTRRSWKSLISQANECVKEIETLYRRQFLPVFIRHLELMSPAGLDRHTALARRYWMRYWQRQRETEEIEKRFDELSTMTRQKIQEIRKAQKEPRQARLGQKRKEYWEAKHAGPSFRLEPSARDQIGSKVKESDGGVLKPETGQLNTGPGNSENTASTLVRKYHVGSYGDNVHPTTASENTTPQSAPPRFYSGTRISTPSQNSSGRSFLKLLYNEIPTKQADEKSRSSHEIETQNNSEIVNAYKKKLRGPKNTTIEMTQNDRQWNTSHGTVKHNERSYVDKMPQDRMRHSHNRGMGTPDNEPSQSLIIEILRRLEVPEAYIDKARTILKNSSSSKGPQHRKSMSSFTTEEFSHSSHSPEVFQKESARLHDRKSVDQANLMQSSNGMRGRYSPYKSVKRGEQQFRPSKIVGKPFKDMGSLGIPEPGIKMLNSKATASEGDDSTSSYTPAHKNTTEKTGRHGVFDRPIRQLNKNYQSIKLDATSQYNHRAASEWRSSSGADTRYTKRSGQDSTKIIGRHGVPNRPIWQPKKNYQSIQPDATSQYNHRAAPEWRSSPKANTSYTQPPDQDMYVIADYIRSFSEVHKVAQEHKAVPLFTKEEEPIRGVRRTYKHGANAPGSRYSIRYKGKRILNRSITPRYVKMRGTGPAMKGFHIEGDGTGVDGSSVEEILRKTLFPTATSTSTKLRSDTRKYPWESSTKSGGDWSL